MNTTTCTATDAAEIEWLLGLGVSKAAIAMLTGAFEGSFIITAFYVQRHIMLRTFRS